ncbi:MAG: GTP 3',8-cyclase MoaA [Actinobacteria bacterium]|nr:GTP 3',8-cyclase MoaA [Actinomycetota bacterium]
MSVEDTLGRPLRDFRISVTDRCNFRCTYCMPKEVFNRDYEFLPRADLLTFEELTRVAKAAVALGAEKFRLTGGEPLMRRHLDRLVGQLADIEGVADIAMTTNAALLSKHAAVLKEAGLSRVTVSLDAIDNEVFQSMNDVGVDVQTVLDGIDAAANVGLGPIKINMVVKKDINDQEIPKLAEHFRGTGHIVRFIEYMDVGATNGWRMNDVLAAGEILARIEEHHEIEPVDPGYRGEVASRYRYKDGSGEIGIIASVTKPFCGDCTRLRLGADGRLFTCLFGSEGTDIRGPIRDGATDDDLVEIMRGVWEARTDRYSEKRTESNLPFPRVEMSYIGG